jgi:predicted HicB family RNase H-like nuclease
VSSTTNRKKRMKRPTKNVRVSEDVLAMINIAAAAEGQSPPDFLSDLLRPILRQRIPGAVERIVADMAGGTPRP